MTTLDFKIPDHITVPDLTSSSSMPQAMDWLKEKTGRMVPSSWNLAKTGQEKEDFLNAELMAARIESVAKNHPEAELMSRMEKLKNYFLQADCKEFFGDHKAHVRDILKPSEFVAKPERTWTDSITERTPPRQQPHFSGPPEMGMVRTIATYIGGFAMLDSVVGLITPKKETTLQNGKTEKKDPNFNHNLTELAISSTVTAAALFAPFGKRHGGRYL